MHPDEYAVMRAAEDRHWWYRGLRAVIRLHWDRHVAPAGPARPRLLDVGCGTGGNLAALASLAEPRGVDLSPVAVAACRARGLHATAVASAASLPFRAGSFDALLSCDVLNSRSLPDRRVPLREMARVLRPGGILLLGLPAYRRLLSPHDEAYGQDHRFTRGELCRLLGTTGFDVVVATYWNTLLFPPVVAARLWRQRFPGRAGSDLTTSSTSGGRVPGAFMALELALLRLAPLPFGLSVFVAGRRRAPDRDTAASAADPGPDRPTGLPRAPSSQVRPS